MIRDLLLVFVLLQLASLKYCQGQTICDTLAPCYSGSTCVPTNTSYECRCPFGYFNRKCDFNVNSYICSYSQCSGYCQTNNMQADQFICIPNSRLASNSYQYTSAYNTLLQSCPDPSICQNGGRCFTYWANVNTQLYDCVCPKGFSGPHCETQFAYGIQPINQMYWPQQIYYEYTGYETFNQNFLLLNTEIKSDMTVNKIEYTLTRGGTFKIGFVKFPNCGGDGEISCADMVYTQYIQGNNQFPYSSMVSNALLNGITITDYSTSSGDWSNLYATSYTNLWIPVVKGTLVVLTQVDAFVGGAPLTDAKYSDLIITNVTNQQYSLSSINYSPVDWAFAILVEDTTKFSGYSTAPTSYCQASMCQNGATCVQTGYSYYCMCPPNTYGQYCQFSSQPTVPAVTGSTSKGAVSTSHGNNGGATSGNNGGATSSNNNNGGGSTDPCKSNPCPSQETCETTYIPATNSYTYTCNNGGGSENSGTLAHYMNFFFSIFDINNFH